MDGLNHCLPATHVAPPRASRIAPGHRHVPRLFGLSASSSGSRAAMCENSARAIGTCQGSTARARGEHRDRRQPDHPGRRSGTVRRQPGHDRLAVQAARLHLPELGDLRRHQRRVGLRAAGRGAQEQRQAGLVAGDGPGARGHRRPGRQHHHGAPGLGHVRPRRQLHRPARRVHHLPPPLPARRAARRRRTSPTPS